MAPLQILICGAGIAGPALATFLLLQSTDSISNLPHITILERSPNPEATYGQNIDIRGSGATIMRKLGLESAVRAYSTLEEGVQIVDEKNQIWSQGAADKSGKIQTGTSDKEILRGDLARIIGDRLREVSASVEAQGGRGVEWIYGDTLDSIDQDDATSARVRFAKSQKTRAFDLVVGADGVMSTTRRLAFGASGEPDRIKHLGMYQAFFSLPSGPTDSNWRRWFHAPGRRGIMIRPTGKPDRSTALMYVLSTTDERLPAAAREGRRGVERQKALMAEYFQDLSWECPRLIKEMKEAEDFYYDPVAQVHIESWSTGRVVLLGDAG